jgi:hypothetical protein
MDPMTDSTIPAPNRPGTFVKGHDHRRFGGGRSPRVTLPTGRKVTLAELARTATLEAVTTLRKCMNDEDENMHVRCRAAGYLLSLGWGAAPKEATLRLVTNNDVASTSDGELLALGLTATLPPPGAGPVSID